MTDGHKRHLMATLLAVEEARHQIEQVAREGRSLANNQRLTPLDEASWAVFAQALQNMQTALQTCIQQLLPEEQAQQQKPEGLAVTLYWLSVLLLHLDEEIVEDLHPTKTVPKFGALEPAEREKLESAVARMHEAVEKMRQQIALLRNRPVQEQGIGREKVKEKPNKEAKLS